MGDRAPHGYITATEAAERMGVSEATAYRRRRDGSGPPYYQVGRRYRASPDSARRHEPSPGITAGPTPRPTPHTTTDDLALATTVRDLLVAGRGAEVRKALTTAGLIPAIQETA